MTNPKKESGTKATAISFSIDGKIAEVFDKVRKAAMEDPEFWSYGQLTRTDLARHLLTKELVVLAKRLEVLND